MKMNKLVIPAVLGAILIGLTGCAKQKTKSKLFRSLSIGMAKDRVANLLGEPSMFRGAIQTENGPLEVFEYRVAREKDMGGRIAAHTALSILTLGLWIPLAIAFECSEGATETYFLYFSNDKLVQWGKPVDWKKPVDHVQEFRFR